MFKVVNYANKEPIKNQRLAENIKILKEVMLGNFSNSKQFTGFGGLWKDMQETIVQKELKTFLSVEQIQSLIRSTSTAYFTPTEIISFCWQIVEKLGFNGGKALEPTCGTGLFFEYMPKHIRKNSKLTGIELESLSYHIAQATHQDVKFLNQAYQDYNEQGQDLIIGNPPYATFTIKDHNNVDLENLKIHHAFLAKSIRLLREGGLCVMVVPSYCLDSSANHAREKISDIADLVFSCRLPDNIFLGAKVTTDIVVFQRKTNPKNKDWKGLTKIELECGYQDNISNYYIENPNHILGELKRYEIFLAKERRKRQGISVRSNLNYVKDNLPSLIDSLKSCYSPLSTVVSLDIKRQLNAIQEKENELEAIYNQLVTVAKDLKRLSQKYHKSEVA
jgi:type I restriction-modification system DNA methylase subunit